MCTWCAYTGALPAAPILWECGKRIEGLWSGIFTGMVTLDDSGLHCGKLRGTTLDWEKRFALTDFPGTTGLWHSRTGGFGDDDRAHPFVSSDNEVALVSQGFSGVFAGEPQKSFIRYGEMLMNLGYNFPSAKTEDPSGKYPLLFGKFNVHVSEIVANTIAYFFAQGMGPLESVQKALSELPEEASSIVIFRKHPGKIFYATTNQSVVAARGRDGVMLSVSSVAFPDRRFHQLPVNSCGMLSPDECVIRKLSDRYVVDETIPDGLERNFLRTLAEIQPAGLAKICDQGLKPLFPKGVMQCCAISTYRTMENLLKEGRLRMETGVDAEYNWMHSTFRLAE
ncbi:MAG: hypothetical protein MR051_05645 [Lentisphaeria bacterium]|nr:hypothetical protein [Lentisphaeria bacterium]